MEQSLAENVVVAAAGIAAVRVVAFVAASVEVVVAVAVGVADVAAAEDAAAAVASVAASSVELEGTFPVGSSESPASHLEASCIDSGQSLAALLLAPSFGYIVVEIVVVGTRPL